MDLPEGCIATIMSLTTPPDACRLSLVSRGFKAAGESDVVWNKFLPPDTNSIVSVSHSNYAARAANVKSKKELYLSLSEHPVLIDDGNMSFSLDKWSGKKCYMISARALRIALKDDPRYWRWISLPNNSRFGEAPELLFLCWLEIRGRIETRMLSPSTIYSAYLVYKLTTNTGRMEWPVDVTVARRDNGFEYPGLWETMEEDVNKKSCFLVPQREAITLRRQIHIAVWGPYQVPREDKFPSEREDGWWEIHLGEFDCREHEDGELEMIFCEKSTNKKGLVVQGIEVRPKRN